MQYSDFSKNLEHSIFVIFVHIFSMVNNAIVELAKLAIFSIYVYDISVLKIT